MKLTQANAISVIRNSKEPLGIILIGPPCCGKSTFIEAALKVVSFDIASTDNLIEAYAASRGKTYSDVFREVNFNVLKKRMMADVAVSKAAGHHVVFDQTNMSVKSRAEKILALKGVFTIAIDFPFDVKVLQARNVARAKATGKFIPDHVLFSMIGNYQAPSKKEGFSEIISIV